MERTHVLTSSRCTIKLHKSRVSSALPVQQTADGPIAQERAQVFAASCTDSNGSYFMNNHQPVLYQPPHPSESGARVRSPLADEVNHYQPRKDVTFDAILVPHHSGKSETLRDEQDARLKKSKKVMGI